MAASSRRSRRRRPATGAHDHNGERWLLTYADMITLLMALFMVLFSISSVNISKYKSLQHSLQDAFSGKPLKGGQSVLNDGSAAKPKPIPADAVPASPAVLPRVQTAADKAETDALNKLRARIEAYAKAHGLRNQLQATVARRGLVVRLLTDDLLFDSGQATLKPAAFPVLATIGHLLRSQVHRPTVVEGHTDNVAIHSGTYPSNWELSTARATSVLRFLIRHGAHAKQLSAAGYANTRPIASNATNAGRHRNRRVEIVVLRHGSAQAP